jgi:hypothetical protein
MFRGSMITFALGFPIGKSHGWGDSGIVGAGLDYHLVLGPLF